MVKGRITREKPIISSVAPCLVVQFKIWILFKNENRPSGEGAVRIFVSRWVNGLTYTIEPSCAQDVVACMIVRTGCTSHCPLSNNDKRSGISKKEGMENFPRISTRKSSVFEIIILCIVPSFEVDRNYHSRAHHHRRNASYYYGLAFGAGRVEKYTVLIKVTQMMRPTLTGDHYTEKYRSHIDITQVNAAKMKYTLLPKYDFADGIHTLQIISLGPRWYASRGYRNRARNRGSIKGQDAGEWNCADKLSVRCMPALNVEARW